MQFSLIATTILALLFAELAPATAVDRWPVRCLLSVWGTCLVPAMAWMIVRATVANLHDPRRCPRTTLSRFLVMQRLHTGFWFLSTVFVFCHLGWPQIVRENWHLGESILLDEVLIMLPVIGGMGLSWAAFHRFDGMQSGAVSLRADLRAGWMQVRLHFGAILAPILIVSLVDDACRRIGGSLAEGIRSPVVATPMIVAAIVGFPMLMRWVWPTVRMRGRRAAELIQLGLDLGVGVRRIYVWNTGGRLANAAVAGCFRRGRYVLLSDGLLRDFPPAQVEAVYLHELGHVRGRHLQIRALAILVMSAWLGAGYAICDRHWPEIFAPTGPGVSPATLAGIAFVAAYAWRIFGPLARLLEHDADLFAARGKASAGGDLQAGAEVLTQTLGRLASSAAARKSSWLYPSIDERIALLNRVAKTPEAAEPIRRQVRRSLVQLAVALVGAAVLTVLAS